MASKRTLRRRIKRLRKVTRNLRDNLGEVQLALRTAGEALNDAHAEKKAVSVRCSAAMSAVDDIATAVARSTQEMGKAIRDARLNVVSTQD